MCSVLNESLAIEVVNNSTLARWLTTAPAQELKTFSNKPIPVIGMMQAPIEGNGWRIEDAEFVVVKDGLKPLIGRDLFEILVIAITQTLYSDGSSIVNSVTTQRPYKTRIANQFPQLVSRIGRSKVNLLNLKFTKISNPHIKRVGEYPLIYKTELIVRLKTSR